MRRTTSSGLFSWLFSGSEEDNEDDPHGYASIASNTFTIPEDGVIHLLQRPDLGPITLDELSVEVQRRTNEILSHQRSANGNGGTQATTMRFRQDVKSLSTACRCIHSLQLTEVIESKSVHGGVKYNLDLKTLELFVSTILTEYDNCLLNETQPHNTDTQGTAGGVTSSTSTTSSPSRSSSSSASTNPFSDRSLSQSNHRSFLLHLAAHVLLSHESTTGTTGTTGTTSGTTTGVVDCSAPVDISTECYVQVMNRMLSAVCRADLPSYALEVTFTALFSMLRVTIRRNSLITATFHVLRSLRPRSTATVLQTDATQATEESNSNDSKYTTSPVVADALALYLGIFLKETLEDDTSLVSSTLTSSGVSSWVRFQKIEKNLKKLKCSKLCHLYILVVIIVIVIFFFHFDFPLSNVVL